MPRPRPNEDKVAFIKRATRYIIKKEGKPQLQAVAIAYSLWEKYKGKDK